MPDGKLKSYEGLLGRTFDAEGVFVTTPNAKYIPHDLLLGTRNVRQRRNGHFGQDDPLLHPQYFDARAPHISCIPYRNIDLAESLAFWTTPSQAFDWEVLPDTNVGRLRQPVRAGLHNASAYIVKMVDTIFLKSHNPEISKFRKDRILCTLRHKLMYYVPRLSLVSTFEEALAIYRHVGRLALELFGRSLWLTVARSRYKELGEFRRQPTDTVQGVVGALTWDLEVAENLFRVGFLSHKFKHITNLASSRAFLCG